MSLSKTITLLLLSKGDSNHVTPKNGRFHVNKQYFEIFLIISVMLWRLSCVVLGQAAVVRDFKWVHNFLATCPSKHFTWKFTLCVVLNQNVCPHASSYQWQWPGFEIEHELHYLGPFKNLSIKHQMWIWIENLYSIPTLLLIYWFSKSSVQTYIATFLGISNSFVFNRGDTYYGL